MTDACEATLKLIRGNLKRVSDGGGRGGLRVKGGCFV